MQKILLTKRSYHVFHLSISIYPCFSDLNYRNWKSKTSLILFVESVGDVMNRLKEMQNHLNSSRVSEARKIEDEKQRVTVVGKPLKMSHIFPNI